MKIEFNPESDSVDFKVAVSGYEKIWALDGDLIVKTWEETTGLKFNETIIEATVANKMSGSHPLVLRYNYAINQKKSILVHELGHRLLAGKIKGMNELDSIGIHKILYLVLSRVWLNVYGKEFMTEAIEFERNLSEKYKTAWDWALAMPDEKRIVLFKKVQYGDLSIIS